MDLSFLLFGIAMNLALTFGFGIFKVLNLSFEQTTQLMQSYPAKTNMFKLWFLWLVPWAGFVYIFYEIFILQRFINSGRGVYEYLEYKLQKELHE